MTQAHERSSDHEHCHTIGCTSMNACCHMAGCETSHCSEQPGGCYQYERETKELQTDKDSVREAGDLLERLVHVATGGQLYHDARAWLRKYRPEAIF